LDQARIILELSRTHLKMDVVFHTLSSVTEGLVPCAIQLKAPEVVDHISTHFVLLCDISESMIDDRKLENVKSCAALILDFLQDSDKLSLISFGDDATVHLKQVPTDAAHKETIRSSIQGLRCNGCTNLSAGLSCIQEVVEGAITQKTGLLILTDGHANRGVSAPAELRSLVSRIVERNSGLSVHCVAYGADHNDALLSAVAQDVQGSYNVVASMQDTAFAFGDTLGGLMSCVFQNVTVEVPIDAVVHGPLKQNIVGDKRIVRIGDIYAGTKPLLLMDIPVARLSTVSCVTVKGVELPTLNNFCINPIPARLEERSAEIELTRLRYECTGILQDLNTWENLTQEQKDGMEARIDTFENKVRDNFYEDNLLASLLKDEIPVLRKLWRDSLRGRVDVESHVMASQHMTTLGTGRGFNTPTAPRIRRQGARAFLGFRSPPGGEPEEEEDSWEPTNPAPLRPTESAFQNPVQSRLSALLRTASSQVNSAHPN
jgi:hypothetical protein